jgi:hypothetical protein
LPTTSCSRSRYHLVFAVEERLELLDAVDVHDRRAMDADEAVGVHAALEPGHRLSQQVRLPGHVQADVVARRLDPVDLVGAQEEEPARGLHDEPLQVALRDLEVLEQREQALVQLAALV